MDRNADAEKAEKEKEKRKGKGKEIAMCQKEAIEAAIEKALADYRDGDLDGARKELLQAARGITDSQIQEFSR